MASNEVNADNAVISAPSKGNKEISTESIEELEQLIPLCRKTLFGQAKARIESGAACSISEASRQIAPEVGKSPEYIRKRITEEGTVQGGQLSELAGTDKHRPKDTIATKWTGDQESYTPERYIDSARIVMGSIDIDPASCDLEIGPPDPRERGCPTSAHWFCISVWISDKLSNLFALDNSIASSRADSWVDGDAKR